MGNYGYYQESKPFISPRASLMIMSLSLLAVSICMNEADQIGSIVAGVIASIGVLFVSVHWIRELVTWRNPFKVTYLIPQAKYKNVEFLGNPEEEQYPSSMKINYGEHQIMFRIKSKVDALKDDITLQFIGDGAPDIIDTDTNPFIVCVDDKSNKKLDWWGIWHDPESGNMLRKNEYQVKGYKITASHEYDGVARFCFRVKGRKNVAIVDLPFHVCSEEDEQAG